MSADRTPYVVTASPEEIEDADAEVGIVTPSPTLP